MTKKTLAAMLLLTGLAAWANADDVTRFIESKVDQFHAVPVPGATPTVVTSIDLDRDGAWQVSGLVNVFDRRATGTVFAGGDVNTRLVLETSTTAYPSLQLDGPTNVTMAAPVPAHIIIVRGGHQRVYLLAWSNQPNGPAPDAFAWGFISAVWIQPL